MLAPYLNIHKRMQPATKMLFQKRFFSHPLFFFCLNTTHFCAVPTYPPVCTTNSLWQLEATARSGPRTRSPVRPEPTITFPARPTRPTAPTVRPASTAPERATLRLRAAASRDSTARGELAPQPKTLSRLVTTPPTVRVSSTHATLERTITR